MTGDESRLLNVGDRVCWQADQADQGTVIEKNWAGVSIQWDNRSEQVVLHNDMEQVCAGADENNVRALAGAAA
jgi:hypothetical protein